MSPKIKVVFDTNVLISAIIFGGNSRTCLEMARSDEVILITSKIILLELCAKLNKKFEWSQEDIEDVISGIGVFAKIVSPQTTIDEISKDPDDNRILEAALTGKADYIVSGDKRHILSLKRYKRIKIVSPQEFIKITIHEI